MSQKDFWFYFCIREDDVDNTKSVISESLRQLKNDLEGRCLAAPSRVSGFLRVFYHVRTRNIDVAQAMAELENHLEGMMWSVSTAPNPGSCGIPFEYRSSRNGPAPSSVFVGWYSEGLRDFVAQCKPEKILP
ncbi:hypothetical protein BDV28DRAFT_145298 [Aspergillus coremiiformis]|uniref:Uncharacterized protein n=1 Tax=Aspergillus coremiiformis TaxID=138285 RepID=A0A5N6ZF13_9EURO|nr:hypothetical protein BDV28DRAFT_145298 [Aspergillus coremiiformis]